MSTRNNPSSTEEGKSCPVVDFDPFSDEMLSDPYAAYEQLREIAPVVKLSKYDCWAVLSYEGLSESLSNWESFSSAAGVGLDSYIKDKPWRPKSIILEVDPPDHNKTRRVLNRVLSRPAMEKMRETFSFEAEKLVSELVERKEFDGVKDLSEIYPLKVFPDAVGLNKEGREHLLAYGTLAFNATYPLNKVFKDSSKNSAQIVSWITSQCAREALTAEGLGADIFAAAEKDGLSEAEGGMLVRSLLSAGVDTTVNGIGNALYCFARFPQQWALLKENPGLIRGALDEILRFEGAVMNFFRTTSKEVNLCGYRIPKHEKLLVLFAAGNRDPQRWINPDKFDITRDVKGHLGFGAGVHACVGQMVARLEVELILTELVKRVDTIEMTGTPVRRLNNALRGLASLPLRVK